MLFQSQKVSRHILFTAAFAIAATTGGVEIAFGQGGQQLTRIEEDWTVAIVEPNSEITAPQFTSVMTPDNNNPDTYFTVEFNHSTSPEFEGGGIQLQTWTNDTQDNASPRLTEAALSVNDEKIRWTQYMELQGGNLEFGLSNLHSSTWHIFDQEAAKLTVFSSGMSNLNNYRVSDSVNSSGVGFSANRVGNMILVEVRAYSGDQLVQTIVVNENLKRGN